MEDSLISQGKESLLIPDQTTVIFSKFLLFIYKMFPNLHVNVCLITCMSNTIFHMHALSILILIN